MYHCLTNRNLDNNFEARPRSYNHILLRLNFRQLGIKNRAVRIKLNARTALPSKPSEPTEPDSIQTKRLITRTNGRFFYRSVRQNTVNLTFKRAPYP